MCRNFEESFKKFCERNREYNEAYIAMREQKRIVYEIQEIIDRMHDTSIRGTIAEIERIETEDDLSDKKNRRREYLDVMHQLYEIRNYDPEYDYYPRMSAYDIYYRYKENRRPHTW